MGTTPRTIEPLAGRPDVEIAVPGSKSHTNRALLCAALADGTSTLSGALFADDTDAMMRALRTLGLRLHADQARASVVVEGCRGDLPPGPASLDVAQSGTTSRFVLALLTLGRGSYVLDGSDQLRARPLGPLVAALSELGATIRGDRLPLTVEAAGLRTARVELPGSISSQFLSGLLMAAPYATATRACPAVVVELPGPLVSKPYVDLTVATMASFGASVVNDGYRRFTIEPQRYRAARVQIEPDASAASYFFAAAAITGGRVRVRGLGPGTLQGDLRFVDVLEQMGATVRRAEAWTEVVGGPLRGIDVDLSDISDTAQTLAAVATFASSPTRVRGIGFIQNKETDRLAAVVRELTKLGIRAEKDADGFTVHPGRPRPGQVATYDDHRMAMSFALLGLVHPGIALEDPGCVAKTFPAFFAVLDELRR
jgi:3-phosphoshikimate 1-carboxyvinyltransferase